MSLGKMQPRVTSFEEQVSRQSWCGDLGRELMLGLCGRCARSGCSTRTSWRRTRSSPRQPRCSLAFPSSLAVGASSCSPASPVCSLSSPLHRTVVYKLEVYIRIVRLFLQEEDSTSAETYFNRASLLYHTTKDPQTQILFKSCQARMFDFSRRFAEASSKYHEISYITKIDEDDRLIALYANFLLVPLLRTG